MDGGMVYQDEEGNLIMYNHDEMGEEDDDMGGEYGEHGEHGEHEDGRGHMGDMDDDGGMFRIDPTDPNNPVDPNATPEAPAPTN